MDIRASMLYGKYSDDDSFDMKYEPIVELKADKAMLNLLYYPPCNFKCQFCFFHNIDHDKREVVTLEKVLSALDEMADTNIKTKEKLNSGLKLEKVRMQKIGFVTISGCECTQDTNLIEIARAIKARSTQIHLHTNGTNPKLLKQMFQEKLIDFVAMDIKASKAKYELVTGVKVNIDDIDESIKLVKKNSPEYKFRTTICKELLTKQDIIEIGEWLVDGQWFEIKGYWDSPIGRGHKQLSAYSHKEMVDISDAVKHRFDRVTLLEGRRGLGGV